MKGYGAEIEVTRLRPSSAHGLSVWWDAEVIALGWRFGR
ncbi:MAG: hypothetical protein JWL58_7273 [Streptosporangiaceae bacterium]|jgi:hypothetical protein|nr:hypothetical protein [Streptosporangiaceae bacterium]